MRWAQLLIFLLFFSVFSQAAQYKSKISGISDFQHELKDDFDEYFLNDYKIKISVHYKHQKLYLKIENKSDLELSYLPLDLNLGTPEERCSLKQMYENFIWKKYNGKKISFEKKFIIPRYSKKTIFYKFYCEKSNFNFITINGLKIGSERLSINLHFEEIK